MLRTVEPETRDGVPGGEVVPLRATPSRRRSIGLSTLVGLMVALAGIVYAVHVEGLGLRVLLQPTALLVVGAGTLGSVLVQYPVSLVGEAVRALQDAVFGVARESEAVAVELVRYARQARRKGVLSLDGELERIADPFLRRGMTLAVDGVSAVELREILGRELEAHGQRAELVAEVFETAGGAAPTIGILGAVLGLIHVMQLLGNADDLGRGIAAAFVSTIYGLGLANLLLLPLGGKLRMRAQAAELERAMVVEGVASIAGGVLPRALEARLGGYVGGAAKKAMAG